ncbi:helix-turn-helix transcriptional regulator [Streptomyces sp. NPDC102406]|uniref:helix-turn-helix transcriptional regulator n=1 Tax=Streptomyces sp. NPDC102406 TaxID=3366171 RepID=UPI00382237D8
MEDIDAIAALQDSVRRRLYEYVAAQGREVGRNEAAEAVGVARTLAAHHLDKLTEVGLLDSGSRRLTGRSGPGAGRPAKVYTPARAERSVSLPARDYRTLAELLAETAEQAGLDARLFAAARRRGEAERGTAAPCGGFDEAMEMLTARGYAPYLESTENAESGEAATDTSASRLLRMRNCPFHVVADRFPPLVCGMNLALLEGLLGASPVSARMDARPGDCCVVIEESKNNKH